MSLFNFLSASQSGKSFHYKSSVFFHASNEISSHTCVLVVIALLWYYSEVSGPDWVWKVLCNGRGLICVSSKYLKWRKDIDNTFTVVDFLGSYQVLLQSGNCISCQCDKIVACQWGGVSTNYPQGRTTGVIQLPKLGPTSLCDRYPV